MVAVSQWHNGTIVQPFQANLIGVEKSYNQRNHKAVFVPEENMQNPKNNSIYEMSLSCLCRDVNL